MAAAADGADHDLDGFIDAALEDLDRAPE